MTARGVRLNEGVLYAEYYLSKYTETMVFIFCRRFLAGVHASLAYFFILP